MSSSDASEVDLMDSVSSNVANKIADEVYSAAISKLKGWFSKGRHYLIFDLEEFTKYCNSILCFKTIASNDTPVFINDIYVPLTIKWERDVSIEIDDNCTLESEDRIIIKGLAGQGKSTILKKLLANTIQSSKRTPIFFELKHYDGKSLFECIRNYLAIRGVSKSKYDLEALAAAPDTIFLLDAFDEVHPKFRSRLLFEIEHLSNKPCKLVCTTRPDTVLDSIPLRVYDVQTLKSRKIYEIIKRTASDREKAIALIGALKRSRLHTDNDDSVLKTPILVALLCISYNLGEEIPETLSQFYRNMFDTVFYKHDNLKGRVERVRYWNDDRVAYLNIFEHFSYSNQVSNETTFSRKTMIRRVKSAMDFNNKDGAPPETIFKEICDITNLIFEDGYNTYRYAHRSIQEYFSASFICDTLPAEKKEKFYKKAYSDHEFYSIFNGVLFFLFEIDYFSFCDSFLVPQISGMLALDRKEIDDNFVVPSGLVELFEGKISILAKFTNIRGRGRKSVDVEFRGFQFDDVKEYPQSYSELFLFAAKTFSKVEDNLKLVYQLMDKFGQQRPDGIKSLTLSGFNSLIESIDNPALMNRKIESKSILQLAALVLFRKKYNKAINDLKNRKRHLSEDAIFDFD